MIIYNWFTHCQWWFSIAMWVEQRVTWWSSEAGRLRSPWSTTPWPLWSSRSWIATRRRGAGEGRCSTGPERHVFNVGEAAKDSLFMLIWFTDCWRLLFEWTRLWYIWVQTSKGTVIYPKGKQEAVPQKKTGRMMKAPSIRGSSRRMCWGILHISRHSSI